MTVNPGSHIGQYRILRKLGAGGMGTVFLAEHILLGRQAAIKTLLPTLSVHKEIVERFFTEARATSSISDPGVVQVFDFGYHVDGTAYIVMELLEGEALADRMERIGPMPQADALKIARQVAAALAAAHAAGVIHRDLKPENLYLVPDAEAQGGERVKLLDFGICKIGDASLTQSGTTLGTPVYMSPEQCRGAGEVDGRSDIYALGCVLFHMLTGRAPFECEGAGEYIVAHLQQDPPVPTSITPGLHPLIDVLLLRCLAKEPVERFQTMQELQDAIGQVMAKISSPGVAAAVPRGAPVLGQGFRSDNAIAEPPRASADRWFVATPVPGAITTGQISAGETIPPRRMSGGRRAALVALALGAIVTGLFATRAALSPDDAVADDEIPAVSRTAAEPAIGDAETSAATPAGVDPVPAATETAPAARGAVPTATTDVEMRSAGGARRRPASLRPPALRRRPARALRPRSSARPSGPTARRPRARPRRSGPRKRSRSARLAARSAPLAGRSPSRRATRARMPLGARPRSPPPRRPRPRTCMTPAERAFSIVTAVLVLHSGSARAQSAEAEVLFRDGRSLVKAGKLAEGCAKIEASERIESSVGTLLNLGDCREKLGKVASAWAAFRKAEATARRAQNDDKREDEARRRAIALEPRMSSLTLEVVQPPAGLVIKRDDEVVDAAVLNTAVPLDPGTYVIVAEAPGYQPWKTDVVIAPKTKRRLAVPVLARAPVSAPVAVTEAPPAERVEYRKVHRTWSSWRKFSVVLGVAGAGAVGTGLYFGMRSRAISRTGRTNAARSWVYRCAGPRRQRSRSHLRAARKHPLHRRRRGRRIGGGAVVRGRPCRVDGRDADGVERPSRRFSRGELLMRTLWILGLGLAAYSVPDQKVGLVTAASMARRPRTRRATPRHDDHLGAAGVQPRRRSHVRVLVEPRDRAVRVQHR